MEAEIDRDGKIVQGLKGSKYLVIHAGCNGAAPTQYPSQTLKATGKQDMIVRFCYDVCCLPRTRSRDLVGSAYFSQHNTTQIGYIRLLHM